MKKYILIVIGALLILGLQSCSLNTDNAPEELEGMWHLEYYKHKGQPTVDCMGKKLFWSFQANLLQLDDKSFSNPSILYKYDKIGNILKLENPFRYDRENGDEPLTDTNLLEVYGIKAMVLSYTFSINGDKLIIRDDNSELHFVKF